MSTTGCFLKMGELSSRSTHGKVRKEIVKRLRKFGLPPDKVLKNGGFLDRDDVRHVKSYLQDHPDAPLKIVGRV